MSRKTKTKQPDTFDQALDDLDAAATEAHAHIAHNYKAANAELVNHPGGIDEFLPREVEQ